MAEIDRQRRHDEKWQHAVLDGMTRMLAVLHDISDGIQKLNEDSRRSTPDNLPHVAEDRLRLMSVRETAAALGITPATIYGWHYNKQGPVATKVGGRLMYRPRDVEAWLDEQRETKATQTRPWRGSYMPGRIGSNVPSTSEQKKRAFCVGSHAEPMAASQYMGRAVCGACKDDVLVNRDGRTRKHYPRHW